MMEWDLEEWNRGLLEWNLALVPVLFPGAGRWELW